MLSAVHLLCGVFRLLCISVFPRCLPLQHILVPCHIAGLFSGSAFLLSVAGWWVVSGAQERGERGPQCAEATSADVNFEPVLRWVAARSCWCWVVWGRVRRNGESVDRSVLKRLLEMLSSLGMYTGSFLPPLLEETQEYYRTERQRLMANPDVKDFLRRAEVRAPPGPCGVIGLCSTTLGVGLTFLSRCPCF